MTPRPVCYAGPTLARARQRVPQPPLDHLGALDLRPPIRRGELGALVRSQPEPGVVVIVDGVFHLGHLAVGHAEIRTALERGWQVWGLSSMGAIRAAEMTAMGMRGFGRVFARFRDDPDFRDDEVALLHEAEPPYREFSEPLLHQREALADLAARGAIAPAAADAIAGRLADLWFGERTLTLLADQLCRAGLAPERAREIIESFDRYRVKAIDLADFIREQPFSRCDPTS